MRGTGQEICRADSLPIEPISALKLRLEPAFFDKPNHFETRTYADYGPGAVIETLLLRFVPSRKPAPTFCFCSTAPLNNELRPVTGF